MASRKVVPGLVSATLVVSSCGGGMPLLPEDAEFPRIPTITEQYDNRLIRVVDEEAGVVCWVIRGQDGIDCMLIEDTLLDQEK